MSLNAAGSWGQPERHTGPEVRGSSINHTVFQGTDGWSFHPFLCMTFLLLFIANTKGVLTWEQTPVYLSNSSHLAQEKLCVQAGLAVPLGSHPGASLDMPAWLMGDCHILSHLVTSYHIISHCVMSHP